jgi:hypothetical protein
MNERRELTVAAMSASESQPGNYALILEDMENRRRMPVIIGTSEAQAIAIAIERMQPARPLTHDLLKSMLDALGARLQEVLIHSLIEGVFHATMLLQTADGENREIDARTSDAIALAVRCDAPIFTYEHVIEEAGILADSILARQKKGSLAAYSLAELEELLKKVIEKEDYESATRIRDYINRRKGGEV